MCLYVSKEIEIFLYFICIFWLRKYIDVKFAFFPRAFLINFRKIFRPVFISFLRQNVTRHVTMQCKHLNFHFDNVNVEWKTEIGTHDEDEFSFFKTRRKTNSKEKSILKYWYIFLKPYLSSTYEERRNENWYSRCTEKVVLWLFVQHFLVFSSNVDSFKRTFFYDMLPLWNFTFSPGHIRKCASFSYRGLLLPRIFLKNAIIIFRFNYGR